MLASMELVRGMARCPCCGYRLVWFGCATWCPCEPTPLGTRLFGEPHECTVTRRLHRHAFRRVYREEDWTGQHLGVVFVCSCGQERRLEPAA